MAEEMPTPVHAPPEQPTDLTRSIPACQTLGLRDGTADGRPGCVMDGRLPAARAATGHVSRSAALILADQALAAGVVASLPRWCAMMTLDLRIDWHGDLPAADKVAFGVSRVVNEGPLCFVEGELLADGMLAATGTARFLVGAMPGGGAEARLTDAPAFPRSSAAAFEDVLAFQPDADGWRIDPNPALVGARSLPAYHGGFVAAALEEACARLASSHRAVNLEVRYLRPARADWPLHVNARAVRAGQMATVLEAEARQGDVPVAIARALFSGVQPQPGKVHLFG